jgi:hypothetical protein
VDEWRGEAGTGGDGRSFRYLGLDPVGHGLWTDRRDDSVPDAILGALIRCIGPYSKLLCELATVVMGYYHTMHWF